MRAGHLSLLLALTVAAGSPEAGAQTAMERAEAEALFQAARALLSQGKIAEACEKFDASNRLDPAPGTMLNLADCLEREGRTASAWISFRDAAAAARKAGDGRRADEAASRAAALEGRLSKLTIEIPREVADLPGLRVERDGKPVLRALWGVAIPLDPGSYSLVVAATGRIPFRKELAIKPGESILLPVPPLSPEAPPLASAPAPPSASAPPPAPPASASASAPAAGQASAGPPPAGGAYRAAAFTAAGLGAVGVVIGAIYGVRASSRWEAAQSHCLQKTSQCRPEAEGLSRDAVSAGNTSTLAFSVGGVLLAAGAALWWLAPPQAPQKGQLRPDLRLGPGHASLSLGGAF